MINGYDTYVVIQKVVKPKLVENYRTYVRQNRLDLNQYSPGIAKSISDQSKFNKFQSLC